MSDKQYRPRLTEFENRVVEAMKNGWKPDLSDAPVGANINNSNPAKILVFDVETTGLPKTLNDSATKEAAEEAKQKLEEAGAKVKIQ